jgi:transposase
MTMSTVIRVKPHLTLEEIDARLKNLHDFWRLRRGLVMRHALVAPAPAKDIACRLGLSVCTVGDLLAASKRSGPAALETTGKGQRQRAYLSVEEERTLLAPFLADSQAGHLTIARPIKKAFAASIGHRVATSTISRLLHRHHWRTVAPRPKNPRSRQEAQETFKKPSPPESRRRWTHARLTIRAPSLSWPKMQDGLGS